MPRPKLTEEERKKRRAATLARYRIKKGMIPGALGRPSSSETREQKTVGGAIVITQKMRRIDLPELPDNPTPEDMKKFIVELARSAAEVGSAPAMIAAAQTLQKEIDRWERSKPPEIIPPKPRPRIPVEIEISTVKCPHCGKTFEA